MTPTIRAALAAGLLTVPVLLETVFHDFGDWTSGELTFAATQLAGWLLVITVCRDLRASRAATRPARVGSAVVLAGALAQMGFAVLYGALVIVGVSPGASFVLFALGFLLLTVGGVTWGTSLLRHRRLEAGVGLLAVAVLGLLAIMVPVDPFHDVFLLTSYLAWVLVGRGATSARAGLSPEVSAASR